MPPGAPGHPCAAGRLLEVLEVLHNGGTFRVNDAHTDHWKKALADAAAAEAYGHQPPADAVGIEVANASMTEGTDPFLYVSARLDQVGHEIDTIRRRLLDAVARCRS